MTERDRKRLEGIDPILIVAVEKLLAIMQILGHPMFVVSGFRTVAQQQALYAQGRTKPGKIVTYCDGIIKKSNHQSGRAVDLAFIDDPKTEKNETWAEDSPWIVYGTIAKFLGLSWGGDWAPPKTDKPHIELRN